jgi:imidazoleglycerol phosphate synthase glutamine amidotransferase subunit HisH
MPKFCINLAYATAVTTTTPHQEQSANQSLIVPDLLTVPNITHDAVSITSNDNSIRLAELENSLHFIHSKRISMQSDHQSIRADCQKVISGVLEHSKEIQAMQSDMHSISLTTHNIRNAVLPNAPPLIS